MKRCVFLFVICLLFLLCACGKDPAPVPSEPLPTDTPEPVQSEAPAPEVIDTAVTIDGKRLPACYGDRDDILLLRADLDLLFGETFAEGEGEYVPLTDITANGAYHEYFDGERDHLYYTRTPDLSTVPEGIGVPVLMYHAVSDDCWGASSLFVSPSEMDKQLAYLRDNGYTTITFEDLPDIAEIEKPVLLTFDDGYRDNYTELFPLLQKYNAKATVFVIANCVGGDLFMTEEQVRELSDSGLVSIQSHTMTHPDLDTLGREDTVYEMESSQLYLTRLTGRQPFVICYPTGKNTELTREVAAEYYDLGILMTGGRYTTGSDLFRIPRHFVSRSTDIASFASLLLY